MGQWSGRGGRRGEWHFAIRDDAKRLRSVPRDRIELSCDTFVSTRSSSNNSDSHKRFRSRLRRRGPRIHPVRAAAVPPLAVALTRGFHTITFPHTG
jgi:hypothetical protein